MRLEGLANVAPTLQPFECVDEELDVGLAGSPIFLINGRDAFDGGSEWDGRCCRTYLTESGVQLGVPTIDQLRSVLTA